MRRMLQVFNTAARQKQVFKPIDEKRITMYVCGPTVYNFAHIGNARPVVVFDTLFRLLRHLYGDKAVVYARNITDVDDKILAAALEAGQPPKTITEKYTKIFHEDIAALNTLKPSKEPRATDTIGGMITLIRQMVERGFAYKAEGHVLFDTQAFSEYGKLSGRVNEESRQAGARVDVESYKKHPADFVLWKPVDKSELGWASDYGYGRPGWHLECSAMVKKHLGTHIDIHGGGHDLIFPHHENEQAQSCAAHSEDYVDYWMHNGFVTVDGHKMSKSEGNFLTIRDARKLAHGEAIRYLLLSAHYRQPVDWSEQALQNAKNNLDKIYQALKGITISIDDNTPYDDQVINALTDDLNTPLAFQRLQEMAKALNKAADTEKPAQAVTLVKSAQMIGLLYEKPAVWFQEGSSLSPELIEQKIAERQQAKSNKDYALADRIRNDLLSEGIFLEDTANGTTWKTN